MDPHFKIVKNSPKYWEFVRTLRNMDGVREGFIEQELIDEISHATYMLQYNNNFWICLDNDTPMGYVGIIDDDIRVAAFMINEVMKLHPNAVAKVKLDNTASVRLFESCGFKKKYYLLEKDAT